MNIQKRTAKEFVKKYRLTNKTLSLERTKEIIKALGFKLYLYNKYGRSEESVQKVLDGLNLTDYSAGKDAFTYVTNTDRIVFYRKHLSDEEALYLLLHEIGHILSGHSVKKGILAYSDVTAEKEANEFAFYVYNYAKRRMAKQKSSVCAAVALAAGLIFSLPYINAPAPETQKTYTGIENKEVYITKSGKSYHNSWCDYISGKNNLIKLTVSEADAAGYLPCSFCKPDITD